MKNVRIVVYFHDFDAFIINVQDSFHINESNKQLCYLIIHALFKLCSSLTIRITLYVVQYIHRHIITSLIS